MAAGIGGFFLILKTISLRLHVWYPFTAFFRAVGASRSQLQGVCLEGSIRVGDGRYHDSTTVSFCGHGRLISCLRACFLHVLPVQRSFPWDLAIINWCPFLIRPSLRLSFLEKHEHGALQQFGTSLFFLRRTRTRWFAPGFKVFWRFEIFHWGVSE